MPTDLTNVRNYDYFADQTTMPSRKGSKIVLVTIFMTLTLVKTPMT